jgi:hypothetical protein
MFQEILKKIALEFEREQIPYMIIGGQAVLVYGVPRLTQDIDITLGIGPGELDDLLGIIDGLGWIVLVQEAHEFVQRTLILPCQVPENEIRVDFIFSFSPYKRQAIERARPILINDASVRFAAIEDVIIHKLIARRPRDLEDIRGMLLKNTEIDWSYVDHWLEQFEETLETPFRQQMVELRKGNE